MVLDVRDKVWAVDASNDKYWTDPGSVSEDRILKETLTKAFEVNKERKFDGVLNINMIHISDPSFTTRLFSGASSVLCSKGKLIIWLSYFPTSESFDQRLKSMNPDYGVRNLDDVVDIAKSNGMEFVTKVQMPANNFVIIFEKT